MEAHTQCASYLEDGGEARIAVLTESFVETLAAEACLARDLRHPLGPGDIAERAGNARCVVRRLSQPGKPPSLLVRGDGPR